MSGLSVVVTGAEGPVAKAVEQAFRQDGNKVVGVVRGDDLEKKMAEADVVVVLDAARPIAPADYATALGAVAQAVRSSTSVERVVTLTLWPVADAKFERLAQGLVEAERSFVGVGVDLVAVRYGLLVGTPAIDGPLDRLLFESEGKLYVPGDGSQRVRPLTIEDLAAIAVAAAKDAPAPSSPLLADGPAEMSLIDLMRTLSAPQAKIRPISWWRRTINAVIPLSLRVEQAVRLLPHADWRLSTDPPPARVLKVALDDPAAVWTDQALGERSKRRARARHARRYRLTEWSSLVAGLFILLGAGLAVIGFQDLLTLTTIGARLISIGLLLAGVFVVVGGLGLVVAPKWEARYAVGFMAGAVLLSVLIGLTCASLINGDVSWWWLGWLYVGLFVAGACMLLWQRGNLKARDFMRTTGRVVGSIVAAGFVVAFVQFAYSAVYVPTTATPAIAVDVELDPGAIHGSMQGTDATVTLKNISSHAVNLIGAIYRLEGVGVVPARPRPANVAIEPGAWRRHLAAAEPVGAAVRRVGRQTLDRGDLLPVGSVYLEPGEHFERQFVVHVPRRFQLASLRVELITARRRFRGFGAGETSVTMTDRGPVVLTVAEIDDPSLLHKLVRTKRYLHVVQVADGTVPSGCGTAQMVAYVDDKVETDITRAGCSDFEPRKAQHYGLSQTSASTEVQLGGGDGAAAVKASPR